MSKINELKNSNTKSYYLIYKPMCEKIESYIPKWITPNMISITTLLLVTVLYLTKIYYNPYILSLCIFVYWLLDNLDAIHARNTNQTSTLGEIIDHCGDMYYYMLFTYMFFNLYRIPVDTTFIILATLAFNLKHLLSLYSHGLSLKVIDLPHIGIEIGVDDILLFSAIMPFLVYFVKFTPAIVKYILYFVYIILYIIFIYIIVTTIIKLYKYSNLNILFIISTVLLSLSYYYLIKFPIIIGLLQAFYVLLMILLRTKIIK